MKTSKPIRQSIKALFKKKRAELPTVKQRGDGKKPLQILRKNFNKMKSVQNYRDIDRSKKDPTRSPLRCANGNSPIKCRVTCDVCRQIEIKKAS